MFLLQYTIFVSSFQIIYFIPAFLSKSVTWPDWKVGDRCKWASNCEFEGYDLYSQQVLRDACSGICADDGNCTHFTWTQYNGGTCWLKQGDNFYIKYAPDEKSVCGYVQRGAGGGSSNKDWPDWKVGDRCKWASNCEFEGYDLYSQQVLRDACSGICADDGNCTHFTWTQYNGGTCWLKQGDNFYIKYAPDEKSVCGYVQRGAGGGSSNKDWPDWKVGDRCKWASNCEFEGYDLYSQQVLRDACSGICADDGNCTHFTWTQYNGGTCWLKQGDNFYIKYAPDEKSVCGYVQRGAGGGSSNKGGTAAQQNEFVYLLLIVALFGLIGPVMSVAFLQWQHKTKVALLKDLHMQLMATTNSETQLTLDPSIPIQQQTENLPYDEAFELPSGCIDRRNVIGQGQFGKVYHAFAYLEGITEPVEVAVKVPGNGMSVEHQNALLSELKIMIYLGRHVNILGLVGAITRNMSKGKLFVVTEYCKYGSLLDFLRLRRNFFVDEIVPLNSSTELRSNTGNDSHEYLALMPTRSTYRSQQDPTWSDHLMTEQAASGFICTTDLLSFCYQTSNGMAFLASKNLIHRDLAARNVLLADGFVVKICDFGLARNNDIYQTTKGLHGPIPVSWMALESLKFRQYTEKSDVWSFGVLLWEVFTLGQVPYTEVNIDHNFVHMLENGHRLQQSAVCPDDVYALMRRCWAENPDLRPNFVECEAELETQLGLCCTQKLEQVKRLVLAGSTGTGFQPQETRFNNRSLGTTAETSFCTAQTPAYIPLADAWRLSDELTEPTGVPTTDAKP